MLPDFRSRQVSQTRELVHRGFRYAEEPRDLRNGENLAFRRRHTLEAYSGRSRDSIVHNGYGIGVRRRKL